MYGITEREVGQAVLRILASCPDGQATVTTLKSELPKYISLLPMIRSASETRTNEELWEQQVRNLRSHSPISGNIFHEGYVVQVTRGIRQITDAGKRRLTAAA